MVQTVYIMWLREVKKFLRSKSRIFGALGQPIFYLLALGFGLGSVFQAAGQGSYFQLLVPGVIGMTIIFTSIFNGIQVIWDRQFGFLKETMVAPVSRAAIMFGRTLGGATVSAAQGSIVLLLVLVLTYFFHLNFQLYSWTLVIPAILVMLLVGLLFSALGIMVASLLTDMQGFQLIMNFLVMPMFFLSGSLFPLTNIPLLLSLFATIDPLSYGVDALRALLVNTTHFGLSLDLAVLVLITVIFLGLGSYFFTRIEV
ncbi:MAG TPA: ABC transporter permease [Candidatus Paceibacterota bacterium]|jgi:ABC-2 type transport system permease protein|nr:ABC transporter permease [Candidatus Paceibacterota bacterium]